MTGYIKLHRQILDSDIQHANPCTRELWQFFLLHAQHQDYKDLKRGQLFFRAKDFQEAYSWFAGYRKITYKKWEITKSMRSICERNMIATTKATQGTLVTVLQFDKYNPLENNESNYETPTKATRKQLATTNINNNDNNVKNDNIISKDIIPSEKPKKKEKDPDVSELYDYMKSKVEIMDGSIKENRQYAYLLVNKLKKAYPGVEVLKNIKIVIDLALKHKYYGPQLTSIKYLYYKFGVIVNEFKKKTDNVDNIDIV